jgi:hypothetical protein
MIRNIITGLILASVIGFVSGCVTTEESDIPWNAPAGWEGSPFIPGLSE